jgi:hypothetical protein
MVAHMHVALALWLKFKKWEVFAGLWFDIYAITFWLPLEKYKIVS